MAQKKQKKKEGISSGTWCAKFGRLAKANPFV